MGRLLQWQSPYFPASPYVGVSMPSMKSRGNGGFTLVELLAVIGIMAILAALSSMAISSLKGSGDFTANVYGTASYIEQARAYAMANNTYVYVGLTEVDASQSSSASPQTVATTTKGGRIAVVAMATKDGSRSYDLSDYTSWKGNFNNGSNLYQVSKPLIISGMHIYGTTGSTSANKIISNTIPSVGNAASTGYTMGFVSSAIDQTHLTFPLGSAYDAGQYNFFKVFYFDPQGSVRLQLPLNYTGAVLPPYLEIDFQPTHGNIVPSAPTAAKPGNCAAIQIDGLTGSVKVYRP